MSVPPDHVDDETILPDDVLWRRVPTWDGFITLDKKLGYHRVTTSAFRDDRDGDPMSVFLAREASLEAVLGEHPGFGVVAFSAQFARSQGQIMYRSPHDGLPGHAKVAGIKDRKVQRAFVAVVTWVRRPIGYDEQSLPDPPEASDVT
ncbi:MAG: hypothetical protein U0132_24020 [Gemmatimonadaceae bacterium]